MLKINKFNIFALLILPILVSISEIQGHGMMLDPASRSSRWRYDKSAPVNYDDNSLYCGGFSVQWHQNKGKCGLCGDNFADTKPRPNELGGKYGQGVITKSYYQKQNALIGIKLTANHMGFFYFNICNLDKFKEESEECFNANEIRFSDGSLKMYIGKERGMIYPAIVWPKGLICKHCVLRWNYQAANNWGHCANGTGAVGCGPQENFKACSDISITMKSSKTYLDQRSNLFDKIFNRKNNFDYVNFLPKQDPHSIQHFDNYFSDSSKDNDFESNPSEFEEDEKTVVTPIINKEENKDIDNLVYRSDEQEKTVAMETDQFYKDADEEEEEYGAFDEVLNKADHLEDF